MNKFLLLLSFVIITIVFGSCCKDDIKINPTNQEKMVGNWKRELINGMNGQIVSTDTVTLTDSILTIDTLSYEYYLQNDYLYFTNSIDTFSYCFEFITSSNMKWGCFICADECEFDLNKL